MNGSALQNMCPKVFYLLWNWYFILFCVKNCRIEKATEETLEPYLLPVLRIEWKLLSILVKPFCIPLLANSFCRSICFGFFYPELKNIYNFLAIILNGFSVRYARSMRENVFLLVLLIDDLILIEEFQVLNDRAIWQMAVHVIRIPRLDIK